MARPKTSSARNETADNLRVPARPTVDARNQPWPELLAGSIARERAALEQTWRDAMAARARAA